VKNRGAIWREGQGAGTEVETQIPPPDIGDGELRWRLTREMRTRATKP
jgi:hypothetical protein